MANKKQTPSGELEQKPTSTAKTTRGTAKTAEAASGKTVSKPTKSTTAKPKAKAASSVTASKKAASSEPTTTAKPTKTATAKAAPKTKAATTKTTVTKASSTTKTAAKSTVAAEKAAAPKKTSRAAAAQSLEIEDLVQVEPSAPVRPASFPSSNEGKITHEAPSSRTPINGIGIYRQARDSRSPIKRSVPREVYHLESEANLPEYYGVTKVQVFIKDTEWLFVYWDFSQQDLLRFPFADPSYRFVLRLLEVAPNSKSEEVDEIAISQVTTSWYVHIPKAGRNYKIQIGLKSNSGDFLLICSSNTVQTPSLVLVTSPDVHYGDNDLESYRQLLKMSGAGELAEHLSSGSFSGDLVTRLSLAPSSFSGSVFSGSLSSSSSTFASETLSARTNAILEGKERKFWLVIDAEVIVYGATEPDAKVSFMGKPIRLNPDGTFGVRMALPDGKIEFPVIATSADGEETKTVRPIVSRKTEPK